jgi:hypothetical protein
MLLCYVGGVTFGILAASTKEINAGQAAGIVAGLGGGGYVVGSILDRSQVTYVLRDWNTQHMSPTNSPTLQEERK